MHKSANIKN